jgi:Ser/Thr protein kinase RdoA (MazF antagonist)
VAGRQQAARTEVPAGDMLAVAAAFRLGQVHHARYLPEGLISRNWHITASRGEFALKQIADAPLPVARRNLRVVRTLHAAGIPAFQPLLTVAGDTVADSGGHGYCLSWWVAGRHLLSADLPPGAARHSGAVLGQVHEGLNRIGPRAGLPAVTGAPAAAVMHPDQAIMAADRLLAQIASLRQPDPWDLAVADSLRRRKALLLAYARQCPASSCPRGPAGWTHGDFHPLNLIWQHARIASVVDWNRIAVRPLGEEVSRSATLLFSSENGEADLGQVAEFAAGYRAVIPLPARDLADAVHRRWWRLMGDYRYLELHYTSGESACDDLIEPAARLLEWWTGHLPEMTEAFTQT